MNIHERIQRLKDLGERHIQQVSKAANESMAVARNTYFELIKLLIAISLASLPLLATAVGLGRERVSGNFKYLVLGTIGAFLIASILGICALLFAAQRFRKNAYEHEGELKRFLKKCIDSSYDPDVIEEYFRDGTQRTVQEGMFWELQLGWFFGQIVAFLVGTGLFFCVIYRRL